MLKLKFLVLGALWTSAGCCGVLSSSSGNAKTPAIQEAKLLQDARAATVKIRADGSTGTGFFVTPSLVVTAGHLCDPLASYVLVTAEGKEVYGWRVYDEDSDPEDLCVLRVSEYHSPSFLHLSPEEPNFGDTVYFVGFPAGVLQAGRGFWTPDASGRVTAKSVLSLWGHFGASGSAVLNSRGHVVGVFVALNVHFHQITYAVPLRYIKGALESSTL